MPTPDLGRDGRPGRVVVDTCVLRALQAGSGSRHDERPEADPAVPNDDRQVRHATTGPRGTERRVDHVVGHHHREPRFRVGQCDGTPCRGGGSADRHALAGEERRHGVGERAGAVHLDAF
ncbi:hypothetical protein Q9Q99_18155 [Curtobacterium flaccumfaciens]|nr:hypothetical protein Q9Q99_18155 [Curtobacterium flaccumfaciens]